MFSLLLGSLAIISPAWAAQPSAPDPVPAPLRDLTWGDLNFLHTTDTHGWLGGHLQEPSFSADWGDYISFTEHLREKANEDNVDLLLIDTGDRVEGNGLYDSSEPKGRYLFDIYGQQPVDLICSGNHELYKQNSSEAEFNVTAPHFNDSYISSNIDIYSPETGELVPLAPRFRKITTPNKGYRILAFGFLFDFTGNANNTVVNKVEDTIKEKWFQDAIRDEDLDLIVVIGHAPARSKEFTLLYKAIRSVKWDIPIQFFGGHMHIRDFKVYDGLSTALASGRFMETIGWLSIADLPAPKPKADIAASEPRSLARLSVSRRYIDNNLFSLAHHAGVNASDFPTKKGQKVSKQIADARHALGLDRVVGCAPQDYYLSKAPYGSKDSIVSWLEGLVLPTELSKSKRSLKNIPAFAIVNTGALRFDIFKGEYTKDTTFLVSPFTSGFRYIPDIDAETARKVLKLLNSEGHIIQQLYRDGGGDPTFLAPPEQIGWMAQEAEMGPRVATGSHDQVVLEDGEHEHDDLLPGYTTRDDHGDDGDDTVHKAVKYYAMPNCIMARIGPEEPEKVDLAYIDFVQPWVLLALRFLGVNVPVEQTQVYLEDKLLGTVIEDFVQHSRDWRPKHGQC